MGEIDDRALKQRHFRHDSALNDIIFVDRSTGWTVGDRGVIWHTADGGTTWRQQESGVTCRLNSVCFIDARRGWAVGGECRPYGHATRGVVLRTVDGGASWSPLTKHTLPLLTRIRFFNSNTGIAIGCSSSAQAAGVFVTNDGGDTWQQLPTDRTGGWLTGDFIDPESGAVAGANGRFATLARRQIVRSPLATPALHSYRAMRLVEPVGGWLVGDGGVVLTTNDLGRSWQAPLGELPDYALRHFDFQAVAVHGEHVWIAGSPGTRVFHSADGGGTWQAATTGQTTPLRALCFVDAEHGWAVGELGNILTTHDGGRTWQPQRRGATRAGMLAVFAEATDVPLEVLAELGAGEGYVAVVELLHATTADPRHAAGDATTRACEAMLLCGASSADAAWRFPLPPRDLAFDRGDLLNALNRANDGRALELLEGHLVRRLRLWRPDVVLTHRMDVTLPQPLPSREGSNQLDSRMAVLASLMSRCIEVAADPSRHVELTTEVGLPAWQVKKVYGVLPAASRGSESIATGRFSPLLGTTLCDYVSPGRRLLAETQAAPPDSYQLGLVMNRVEGAGEHRGVFGGISLAYGSDARRPQSELPVNDLDDLRRIATRRRHLEELLERSAGHAAWAGQVANLTAELRATDGAELLAQLADGYRSTGRVDLAADTYYLLARRYPDHPFVDRALVWLVQFYASSEAGQGASHNVAQTLVRTNSSASRTEVRATSFEESDRTAPGVGLSREDRLRRALQLSDYLKSARPTLYAEPAVRFAEVAAQRQLGFPNAAKRYFLSLGQLPEDDPWRQCADAEEWLAKPGELPPACKLGTCRRTHQPPHLDGKLDESFWSTADRLVLRGAPRAAEGTPAVVQLAYDDEYLYLAVRCPKSSPALTLPSDREGLDQPRPRDGDLSRHDRVTISLDIDRDFSTAFELTVDCRGWTHDACWGDVHWNPAWYVAADGDETSWTIEAAVPLAELTATPPAARHVWAVAVRRMMPRVGYESWAGEDSPTSPGRFGMLVFE